MEASAQSPGDLLLRLSGDVWAKTVFGHDVPRLHSWFWRWALAYDVRNLVFLFPGGHGKTTVGSTEFPIRVIAADPNIRIAIIQKTADEAEDVMSSIQAELEGNETLIDLYGQFKPSREQIGYPWSTKKMRVAQAQPAPDGLRQKTHTLMRFGSGQKILGKRFDLLLIDDVAFDDNSNTPEARYKLERWLSTEAKKTLIGSKYKLTRIFGTAFNWGDLYHTKMRQATCVLKPGDWREPEDLTEAEKSGYVVIVCDAEVGMEPGQTIWPAQCDWKDLEAMKLEDGIVDYNRRLRNRIDDPTTQRFRRIWFEGGFDEEGNQYPGCLNRERVLGDYQADGEFLSTVAGADPGPAEDVVKGKMFGHAVTGFHPHDKSNEKVYVVDLFTKIVDLVRGSDKNGDFTDKKSQVGTIVHRHNKYGCRNTYVEKNGLQGNWISTVKVFAPDIARRIKPHTTQKQKWDPKIGIEGFSPLIENGLLDIPYGDENSRYWADMLIDQFIYWPNGPQDDLLMALWISWAARMKKRRTTIWNAAKWLETGEKIQIG